MSQGLASGVITPFGEWEGYTPGFTNFSLGDGVIDLARFAQASGIVVVEVQVTLGSTSSVTGVIQVDLPVTAAAALGGVPILGMTAMREDGVATQLGRADLPNTTQMGIGFMNVSGSDVRFSNTGATAPFTWGTSDWFAAKVIYEPA